MSRRKHKSKPAQVSAPIGDVIELPPEERGVGADVVAKFAAEGQDLVVFGHSHYPVLWREGGCIVVNPGSVGQPRDRRPGACWALWDTASHAVTLHRESYDAAPLIAEARRRDPQLPYLWKVLTRTEGAA